MTAERAPAARRRRSASSEAARESEAAVVGGHAHGFELAHEVVRIEPAQGHRREAAAGSDHDHVELGAVVARAAH